jgi:O-antigen/teichoic acid export membrane protein
VPVYLAAAGTEAFGTAELITSAVVVAAIVLRLGIVNAMSRFTLGEGRGDWAPVVHSIFTFVLVTSTAGALAGLLARRQLAGLLDVGEDVVIVGVFGVWVQMNLDVLSRLYRVQRRARAFVGFQLANVAVTISLTVTLVVIFDLGAVGLLLGNFAGSATVLVAQWFEQRRSIGVRGFDRPLTAEMLRFAFPLMPTNLAIWVLNLADRVQLQRLAGAVELGEYAAAAKVAAGMTLFLAAFQAAWTPFAHQLRGEHGDEVAKRTYSEVFTFWAMTMGWAVAALTLVSAPYIALTFPDSARDAIPVVPLLAGGIVLYGGYLIVSVAVTIAKATRATPFIAAVAGGTNVGLNFWFIPWLGIVGAGITTVIGYALLMGLQWLNARRVYPIAYDWSRVGRVAGWTVAVIAVSIWVLPVSSIAGIAARIALAAAYPAGLLAVGALSRSDVARARALWRSRSRRRPPPDADDEDAEVVSP